MDFEPLNTVNSLGRSVVPSHIYVSACLLLIMALLFSPIDLLNSPDRKSYDILNLIKPMII